jgi:hypothetical protein
MAPRLARASARAGRGPRPPTADGGSRATAPPVLPGTDSAATTGFGPRYRRSGADHATTTLDPAHPGTAPPLRRLAQRFGAGGTRVGARENRWLRPAGRTAHQPSRTSTQTDEERCRGNGLNPRRARKARDSPEPPARSTGPGGAPSLRGGGRSPRLLESPPDSGVFGLLSRDPRASLDERTLRGSRAHRDLGPPGPEAAAEAPTPFGGTAPSTSGRMVTTPAVRALRGAWPAARASSSSGSPRYSPTAPSGARGTAKLHRPPGRCASGRGGTAASGYGTRATLRSSAGKPGQAPSGAHPVRPMAAGAFGTRAAREPAASPPSGGAASRPASRPSGADQLSDGGGIDPFGASVPPPQATSPEAAAPYLRARRRASGFRGEPRDLRAARRTTRRPPGRRPPRLSGRGRGTLASRTRLGQSPREQRATRRWQRRQVQRTSQRSKTLRSSERRKAWTSTRGNTGGTKLEPRNNGERASRRGDAPRPAATGKAPKGRALSGKPSDRS